MSFSVSNSANGVMQRVTRMNLNQVLMTPALGRPPMVNILSGEYLINRALYSSSLTNVLLCSDCSRLQLPDHIHHFHAYASAGIIQVCNSSWHTEDTVEPTNSSKDLS